MQGCPSWSPYCFSVYSSFLLVVPAVYSNNTVVRALFAIMACVSVLHHAYYYHDYCGKGGVDVVDKLVVHGAVLYTLVLSLATPFGILVAVYYCCLAYIAWVYYIGGKAWIVGPVGDMWHSSMHAAAALGTVCLLCARGNT